MPLACYCDDEGDWFHEPPNDFAPMHVLGVLKKCASCGATIKPLAESGRFFCFRIAAGDIEERIYGEGGHVYMADRFMCDTCTGLYFSLSDLGFCLNLGENMLDLAKEYGAVYGPKPTSVNCNQGGTER